MHSCRRTRARWLYACLTKLVAGLNENVRV